jgi:hypothetical protein
MGPWLQPIPPGPHVVGPLSLRALDWQAVSNKASESIIRMRIGYLQYSRSVFVFKGATASPGTGTARSLRISVRGTGNPIVWSGMRSLRRSSE